ncbi:beta strand repeat-containing protein [Trinickia fusca]|nr:filamentous hemagglutinin N-terminal domain-containing protein [Trinickia fusca]
MALLIDETAQAAAIVDPRAPIPFQPTITQTSTGISAVNIAAPNANGVSLNQYQSFNVDSTGLVLNNSLVAGTPLLGGALPANPHLGGRTASTIINEVTSTGPASTLMGPLEVFGSPAAVIISSPNGISVNGLALTNISGLVLTTGTPQFLTGSGGTLTDFPHASAVAYNVSSGRIIIDGPQGAMNPGVGIEGTVGDIDLIGQTVSINAPLRADQRVNIIAGNQTVTPAASGSASYSTIPNGTANKASVIDNNAAIDASQYGSVTSGQIFIVSTAAGMGVNMQGTLAAAAGNAVVTSNGDISVGNTFANQDVTLSSAGNTTIAGTGLANQNYTVNANGDVNAPASVSAVHGLSMNAGGSLSAGKLAANGHVAIAAQNSMTLGSASGQDLTLHTATGDLAVNSSITSPGKVEANAGRDLWVSGSVESGNTVTLKGARNASVNGAIAGASDMTLMALSGTLATTGNVGTLGALTVTGAQSVSLGGAVFSSGDAAVSASTGSLFIGGGLSSVGAVTAGAGQDVTITGSVHSSKSSTITAARDVALNGSLEADGAGNAAISAGRTLAGSGAISAAHDAQLSAGRDISISGGIQTGNNLFATAGANLSVRATTVVGAETLTATAGSATLAGNALVGKAMSVTAGNDLNAEGGITSLGDLGLNAQSGSLKASGQVSTAGAAVLNAGRDIALNAQTTVTHDARLTANNITTQGVSVGGNLIAQAVNTLDTSAGQLNAAFNASAPELNVTGSATLKGANVSTANAVVGGTYAATGTTTLKTGGTAAYLSDATLAGGGVANVGRQMASGNLNVSGAAITNQGQLSSLKMATLIAVTLDNEGTVYAPTFNVSMSGGTTNSGGLFASNALTFTAGSLNNSNGLIFAGDVNHPTAATGNATVTITGGNGSFNNTNGKVLAQNVLTLSLPNQTIDPSTAAFGTISGGYGMSIAAQAISNSGSWALPSTKTAITTSQGTSNSGSLSQGGGTLTLTGGVSNAGTLSATNLTINGSLTNQTGGIISAGNALILNGSASNRGIVQALNALNISGTNYDNTNGITRAGNSSSAAGQGNVSVNLSGDLANGGGTLTAVNDLAIAAANVNNSTVSGAPTTSTATTTVVNIPLVMATAIGTELFNYPLKIGGAGMLSLNSTTLQATIGGLLSSTGNTPGPSAVWSYGWGGVILSQENPVATSGTVQFVKVPVKVGENTDGGTAVYPDMWVVQDGTISGYTATRTVSLPTVDETTTIIQSSGVNSVIAAGHNLTLTANSLNNQAGTVTAGNDVNVHVQSLSNGGQAYSSSVTDTVNAASLNAFLATLNSMNAPVITGVTVPSSVPVQDLCPPNGGGGCMDVPPISFTFDKQATSLPSTSSSVTVQGPTGRIAAGHDLNLSGGSLTNAGALAAGNDVNIAAKGFTNQGTNTGTTTTTAGCAAGVSNTGCSILNTSNPNSQNYSYQQINSNVTAGNDVVIAAGMLNNKYANIAAGRNVIIGGAGTLANDGVTVSAALTQAGSVANVSGAIEAGYDVNINAASLTNSISAPAYVHENYGRKGPFAGCEQNCETYIGVQSGNAAIVSANHNVSLQASAFSNTGSLVTALNNVSISATNGASSDNQYFQSFWHADLYGPSWGCAGNAAQCASLYGAAYSPGDAQAAPGLPSAAGFADFVPSTIQAGNALSVKSPTLTNTGNVIGQAVSLSGAQLVNGLTNPHVYTPAPVVSGQVITLGPPAMPEMASTTVNSAGLVTTMSGEAISVTGGAGPPPTMPIGVQTIGKPVAPVVEAATAQTTGSATVSYFVNNPASFTMPALSPGALLAALPANLQPGKVPFYYDPYTENQQIEQAALQSTGRATFYSTTSAADSTDQASVQNQQKKALYGAALQYAKEHNIALGTQLSQTQLALVSEPMLWYVEQSVPEPGCSATGNGTCPTVRALVPEVLLPQNYAQVNADGEISGKNVTLDYNNSILNTGSVSAQSLAVNTGTLTNEQRSTDVGLIYQAIDDGYIAKTTGTVVQQGGFMSAANYTLNAQAIQQIGGALQQVGSDGSVDQAATTQLLTSLKGSLGGNFTQSAVSNHLDTSVIGAEAWYDQLWMVAVIIGISIMSAGAASAAIGTAAGATAGSGTMFAAGGGGVGLVGAGVGNAALSAGFAGMMNSAMSQTAFGNGSFNVGTMFETGAVSATTAGLLNGITVNGGSVGWSWGYSPNSLAALAGVQSAGSAFVPVAGGSSQSLPTVIAAIGAEATIQAGVQTAIQGGSFLTNLRNSVVSDAAAAGAYAVGEAAGTSGSLIPVGSPQYILTHGLLGCAAGAAEGNGCAAGAMGGAASAAFSPDFIKAIDPSGASLDQGQLAALATFSTLVGGGLAGLAGLNAQSAVTTAQNEALNNSGAGDHTAQAVKNGGVLSTLADAFVDALQFKQRMDNWLTGQASQFVGVMNRNSAQTPPSDPNPLVQANNGNPPMTGGAVVTPPVSVPLPNGTVATTPPLIQPGAPILSSGDSGDDTGGGATGQGPATNTPVASEGTANAATLQGLKGQLANENLANIAAQDSRLAAAVTGSGTSNPNFSIGTGTVAEANALGQVWVGDGATLVSNQVACPGCLVSADGTMIYRPPQPKASPFATTGVQANFVRQTPGGAIISNGHLNVIP